MSEKSKGDTLTSSTSRIVNNPLLSANIANLTFDDFENKPVILPAAPPVIHTVTEDMQGSFDSTKRIVTVGQTPDIDAETLSEINLNAPDDDLIVQQQLQQLDLNDNNAFPQIQHEPRPINNNEIADDSLLSQAASSFSQLPSVASTVFSTFSKVINNYSPASGTGSREQSSERDFNANTNNSNFEQQEQQNIFNIQQFPASVGFNNQYLNQSKPSSSVPTPEPPKLFTPPPLGSNPIQPKAPALPPPLTAGGNTYRLSSKKKTYAQIPGLSVHNVVPADESKSNQQNINLPPQPIPTNVPFVANSQPIPQQPINSFLNETNTYSQSQAVYESYQQNPFEQQEQSLSIDQNNSKLKSSSSVGSLLSGVTGVIQNISGLVKSTVTSETNQFTQENTNQSNFGFIQPPSAPFLDTDSNQNPNPSPTSQIGFESFQSVPFDSNTEFNKPTGPPPTLPPPATGGSSFRLQKGTRLYKSPFAQTTVTTNSVPPYPTPQNPGLIDLPYPPDNSNKVNQGFQITDNILPIPAPESFQNFSSQNIPQPQLFNILPENKNLEPNVLTNQISIDQQFSSPQVKLETLEPIGQHPPQSIPLFSNTQQTQSDQTTEDYTQFPATNFFGQIENTAPVTSDKDNVNKIFTEQQKSDIKVQNQSVDETKLFSTLSQTNQESQLIKNHLINSSSVSSAFQPFQYSNQINSKKFESVLENSNLSQQQQQEVVQKTSDLRLQENQADQSFGPPPPPPSNLPPPPAGTPQGATGTPNPFRRDSAKSHHPIGNFFIPKPEVSPAQFFNPVPIAESTDKQDIFNTKPDNQPNQQEIPTNHNILQNTQPEQSSIVGYFNPTSSDLWAQQIIQEVNPSAAKPSIIRSEEKIENSTFESTENFPEKFNFSSLQSDYTSNFKYLPPPVQADQTHSDINCPPIEFKPPVPLPVVDGKPQYPPGSSIIGYYNPTPSHEWAQQVIDSAQQGLSEIPQRQESDTYQIHQGTIDPPEEFPEKFDFSSVLPSEEQKFKYLPSPVDANLKAVGNNLTEKPSKDKTPEHQNDILHGNKENERILDPPKTEQEVSNLANYFDRNFNQSSKNSFASETENQKAQIFEKVDPIQQTFSLSEQQSSSAQSTGIQNPVSIHLINSQSQQQTLPAPQLTDFFQTSNTNQKFSLPLQNTIAPELTPKLQQNTEIHFDQATKNNIPAINSAEKVQQPNSLASFFQDPKTDQQSAFPTQPPKQTNLLSASEIQNIQNFQQQQVLNQPTIQQSNQVTLPQQQEQPQPASTISFFDNINNQTNISTSASQQSISSAAGQFLLEEDQRIQNFFNNPPPQNLNNNSVNDINFKNLYGCGGIKSKPFPYSDSNLTPGKYSDNRSATPYSNIVEPPSSACSEFSSEFSSNNTTQNSNQTNLVNNKRSSDPFLNDIPDELVSEYEKMSSPEGTSNVVYIPAKKHWFYKKETKKQFWVPFSHKDSDALESAYSHPKRKKNFVAVEGGRFDVNIRERTRKPAYWNGPQTEIRRCSWFYKSVDSKYVPYEEHTADYLEAEYRRASNTGEWQRKIQLENGETVVFHAPTVLVHFLQSPVTDSWGGATKSTTKPRVVKRDLDDFTIEEGETNKVDHLLFMVHGIGSGCDLKFRGVEEVVEEFRSIAYQLVQAHYKNSVEAGHVGRIEVLPVSWHHELHSAEYGVDEQLKAITLDSIPKLRNFSNDTIVDALFYTSPVFCEYIINTVANCINRVYLKFCQRNEDFTGQVSVAGHSLGSLILFDLLCNQKIVGDDNKENSENLDLFIQHPKVPNTAHCKQCKYTFGTVGAGQPTIDYPQLLFAPKKFFALGSPIGMFVTVRGIGKLGLDFKFPTCPSFYNIFHPYDPIAYRIEALVNPDFSSIRPVVIPHHKGRKRMHLELKETVTRVSTEVKQRLTDMIKGTLTSFFSTSKNSKTEDQEEMEKEVDKVLECQLSMDKPVQTTSSTTSDLQNVEDQDALNLKVGSLNNSKRIDYVLQEAPLEFFNEYLFALTSHVCYWDSEDTILFMVKEIYTSMGISTDAAIAQPNMTIERPGSSGASTPSKTPAEDN